MLSIGGMPNFLIYILLILFVLSTNFVDAQNRDELREITHLQGQLKKANLKNAKMILDSIEVLKNSLSFEKSKAIAEENIAIIKKNSVIKPLLPDAYRFLGWLFYNNYYHENAVQYFLQSAKIYEEQGNKQELALSYYHVAYFQQKSGNVEEAKRYYIETLKFSNNLDARTIINCYNGLGLIERATLQYAKSRVYFDKALRFAFAKKDTAWIGILNGNIGSLEEIKGNYQNAIEGYTVDLKYSLIKNEKESVVNALIKLGKINIKLNQIEKAELYLDSAFHYSKRISKNEEFLRDVYEGLSKIAAIRQNFAQAYQYHLLFAEVREKEWQAIEKADIAKIQSQYDVKQKQIQLELMNKTNLINQNTIKQQNLLTWITIVWIGLLLIVAFVLYRNNLIKQKSNQILNAQRNEILKQKEKIEAQTQTLQKTYNALKDSDHFKQGLTEMIIKDIKNPLNTILGLANTKEVKEAAKQMFNMVQNLMNVQKLESKDFKLNQQDFLLYKIINEAFNQVKFLVEKKSLHIESLVNQQIKVFVDFDIAVRVFVNLFTNAIRYAPNNGRIIIKARKIDDFVDIIFKDNGHGIPEDKQEQIFKKFNQMELRTEGNVRSTGLGLAFCKMAVEAHQGEIGIESEIGIGTAVWFTLPFSIPKADLDKSLNTIIEDKSNNIPTQAETETANVIEQYQNWTMAKLDESERLILKPFLEKLHQLSVFEYSDVKNILDSIDANGHENISNWKKHLENAVKSCNEDRFSELIGV